MAGSGTAEEVLMQKISINLPTFDLEGSESSVMKLNPQQAPLYGECLLTVQLCDEEIAEEEEDVEFYLLFSGSTQTHLSSTVRTSHVTLQAICPAHDCCESVRVTLCSARPGRPAGPLGEGRFGFVQDLAFDLAQFLVSAAGRRDGLEGTALLDQCEVPLRECERLDRGLARALRHLSLPQGWSVLGTSVGTGGDPAPQETLLHFAARRGLRRVAVFLLRQPGGPEALGLPNKQGATPANVAERRGHGRLQQLFAEVDGGQNASTDTPWQVRSGGRVVRHHPRLNTYTLTSGTASDRPPPSLQREVEELRRLVRCHVQSQESQAHSKPLQAADELSLSTETETGEAPLDRAQPRSPIGAGQWTPPTACERHEAVGDPPNGPPLIHGNGRGRRVGPHGNLGRDYEAREEEGAGLPAAWGLWGGEAAPERSRDAPRSQAEDRSSALTGALQSSADAAHGFDPHRQERESCSEKEEEREDWSDKGQTSDRAQPAPSGSPSTKDMGLTQSQEHPETPDVKEEPSVSRRRTGGDVSPDEGGSGEGERDGDMEDASFAARRLFGPAPPDNTGGHIKKGEESKGAPESARPMICKEELKSETNNREQSKETAAGDGGTEREREREIERHREKEGGLSQAAGTEREPGDCGQAPGRPATETGNHSKRDNASAESPCGAKGESPQAESTEEYLAQSDPQMESAQECLSHSDPQTEITDECFGQSNPEMESSKECFGQSGPQRKITEECFSQSDTLGESKEGCLGQSDTQTEITEVCIGLSDPQMESAQERIGLSIPQIEIAEECFGQSDSQMEITERLSQLDPQRVITEECISQSNPLRESAQQRLGQSNPQMEIIEEYFGQSCSEMEITNERLGQLDPQREITEDCLSQSDLQGNSTEERLGQLDPQMVSTEECFGQSEEETGSADVASQMLDPVWPDPLAPAESASAKEKPADEMTKTAAHTEDISSCFSADEDRGSCSKRGGACDVRAGTAPAPTRETTTEQEVDPTGEREVGKPSVTDGPLSPADSQCSSGGVSADNDVRSEENCSENAVISLSTELYPQPSSNQGTTETSRQQPSADPQGAAEGQCRGSEPKQEDLETSLGSEVTERDAGESSVHSDTHTEEVVSHGEGDTQEHEGAVTSYPEVVSLNNGGSETKSCPTPGKEPAVDTVVRMDGEPEEGLKPVDSEPTADKITTDSEAHRNSAGHDPAADPECSTMAEAHDPTCPLGPPCDPASELGSEEEQCEDAEERKRGSSEGTHTAPAGEAETVATGEQADSQSPGPRTEAGEDTEVHREKDPFFLSNPFADPPQQEKQSPEPPESSPCPTHLSAGSSVWAARLDSGSDGDCFSGTETAEDGVFRKVEAESTIGDSASDTSASCTSNEDAAGVGPPGSAPVGNVRDGRRRSSEELQHTGGGEAEKGGKNWTTEVPGHTSLLWCPARSPSPFRRRSWGPGKTPEREAEVSQGSPSLGKRTPTLQRRSYSLEGLATNSDGVKDCLQQRAELLLDPHLTTRPESEERGSLVSLTEEELCSNQGERSSSLGRQISGVFRTKRRIHGSMTLPLTKSVSLLAINQRELDGMRSFSSVSGSLGYSISEEDPGPLRAGVEGKSVTKVGRTFSYLRSKMYKKTKDKEKEKSRGKEKEREAKEKDKRTLNGHLFSAISSAPFIQCHQCHKAIDAKEASYCTYCSAHVHKACRETLPACTTIKMKMLKQHFAVPDSSTFRSKYENGSRRHGGIMPFSSTNLSKSISISNIAGPVLDEIPLKALRYLSLSTDSLHKASKVNESNESLADEGTEMMDSQLMGEFEAEAKDLEADSWSFTVDRKFLKQLRKDVIKRQDVIYELMQTEMHHVRTLRIVSEVYSKGLLQEVQLEARTVERVFPALDELLDIHSGFLARVLDRKRESRQENGDAGGFLVRNIGDVLVAQFSGSNAERMKKVYGRFCSHHKEALNFYKELHAKDKRFQAFIKKKMSSPVVRRLGIPECILLVTQRITKYPVLLQRMLQCTEEGEEDHAAVTQALGLVKEVIAAVDSRVNDQEKKQRLREVHRRTDGRSIMRMRSGQMFAREDLLRGRRLLHDGPLQLKTSAGRLKDVQALLLSDVFVFLQEKDQKYVFASLDQRSTVLSLQKLIVREVANEEKGLFLITAGIEQPEMLEAHASSKEERNAWIQLIREALSSMQKEEDEGIPSESEDAGDKRVLDTKAREMRDQLHKKDQQIVALLEEKLKVFRDMGDDGRPRSGALFRAGAEDSPAGELVMKDALREVETLQTLVNGGLGGAVGQQVGGALEPAGSMGSVWLPRRPETFGDFDRNQMNISQYGGGDSPDLQRTESDGALKKGGNPNLLLLLKRDSEHVLHSTCRLHELLNTLQAVVVQQDTFLEEQRRALSERPSSSPSSSSSSWRSSSLIEQEKQRSLEKQRQEAANLQRQQVAHAEERRRRECEWEVREQGMGVREAQLVLLEEETQRGTEEVLREQQELRRWKEQYQRDLERLREAQRRLERDREQVGRELESMEQATPAGEKRSARAPSSASEDSLHFQSSVESMLSSSPGKDSLTRVGSKRKGKTLNPFASNPSQKATGGEGQSHIPGRLLQLAKTKEPKEPKEKKEKKKKKKGKGHPQPTDSTLLPVSEQPVDGEILFC